MPLQAKYGLFIGNIRVTISTTIKTTSSNMELYELNLHFPAIYRTLDNKELTLRSVEYFDSEEAAISRAQIIAGAFVTPRPDYWYLTNGAGLTIWTDSPEQTKQAIRYDLMTQKPVIIQVIDNNN